jgi:uncharacterized membrane protein
MIKRKKRYVIEEECLDNEYNNSKTEKIYFLYVLAIIIWALIIIILQLWEGSSIRKFFLMIPVLVFLSALFVAPNITEKVEKSIFEANFLTLGIVVIVPLLAWISKSKCHDKLKFVRISIIGVIISLLSYIDFWVNEENLFMVKHIQSVLQTISIVLIVYALYSYFEKDPSVMLQT